MTHFIRFGYDENNEVIVSGIYDTEVAKSFYYRTRDGYKEAKNVRVVELNKENLERLLDNK